VDGATKASPEVGMEQRIAQMLEIAQRIMAEGRQPTDEERVVFLELQGGVAAQPLEWKERFADLIDRFAAALEGVGF